ncbi:MAG: response regulator [PVC group bacterium]|nr:response regulator [PVC group bacterium]
MKNHYTTTEVSKLLGVTTATVNSWINQGALPSFKTPGGHNRIRQDHLLGFLTNNNIPIPPELGINSSPKVLIVDDDEDVRDFVLAVLEDIGYQVDIEIALNGYTAGNKVVKFRPDIVILDIMLPGVNGNEICRQIREELGKDVKVLAITGYYSEENKRKILEAGANAFMRKPMLLDELKKVVNKFILSYKDKYHLQKKSTSI